MFYKRKRYESQSYSQCGEDLIVKYIFDVLQIPKPTYLDIGAHDPFFLSNTALFYKLGSQGINIEPDATLFPKFLKHRKKDINLNIGIGKEDSVADFYVMSVRTLNTFSKNEAERYQSEEGFSINEIIKTRVSTINSILKTYNKGIFPEFLNIDAEGVDEIIIKSIDFSKNYPLVICIETLSFSTSGREIKNTELINFLIDNGYMVYADTYINTIFTRVDTWRNKSAK
jgi:FkbM family methyltransferase